MKYYGFGGSWALYWWEAWGPGPLTPPKSGPDVLPVSRSLELRSVAWSPRITFFPVGYRNKFRRSTSNDMGDDDS